MKPLFPMKCGMCRERAVSPAVIPYTTDVEYEGRSYQIAFPALEVLLCAKCGTIILPSEADQKITDALQRAAGILLPDEIRRNREALGLTQKELAELMQEHAETVARWERGGQLQSRSMDLLLRLFFKLPQVRQELGMIQATNGMPKETPTAQPIAS